MSAFSIWLVPPPTSPTTKTLTHLITTTIPAYLSTKTGLPPSKIPAFAPHLTFVSGSFGALPNPQEFLEKWFSSVTIDGDVSVKFVGLGTEEPWNKKLFLRVEKEQKLCDLAAKCGAHVQARGPHVQAWDPHVSLAYGEELNVTEDMLGDVERILEENGVGLSGEAGWRGGAVWLVETDGPVEEWKVVAKVELA